MKTIASLSLLLALFCYRAEAQSANCADSVRTTYFSHEINGSLTYTITVDTFDLDSGYVKTFISSGIDPNQMILSGYSVGYWSKYLYTYDSQNRIIERKLETGSVNGWKDSLRTQYVFDAVSGNLLTETSAMWDGASWQQSAFNEWTYDVSGNLILLTQQNFSLGNTRTSWSYSGSTLLSKTVEVGSGNTWTNNLQYIFVYGSSGRDSVTYLKWVSANNAWDTLGTQAYSPGPDKGATFTVVDTVIIGGLPYLDTYSETIDTLENILSRDELQPDHNSTMGFFYNRIIEINGYFNGTLLNTYSHSSQWFEMTDGELGWYCTSNDLTSSYDSLGYITQWVQQARCVMPRVYTTTYTYDSEHRLITETGFLDANTSSDSYEKNIYYTNPTTMVATFVPFGNFNNPPACQGALLQNSLITMGGCGNYHYQWIPAINISSDTVANPIFTVADSTLYTVNITDDNGNSASAQYAVNPLMQAEITLDTLPCVGCPAIFHCNYTGSGYIYQWYFNGNLIIGGQDSTYEPTQTGYYYVEVRKNFFICTSNSDSIYYVSTLGMDPLSAVNISLHPNPASDISHLKLTSAKKENFRITLNSISGRNIQTLFNGNAESIILTLDAADYSPGVYFISVCNDRGSRQYKWIVQR